MTLATLCNQHSVTHLRRSETRGAAGGPVLTLTTVATLRCRIQPRSSFDTEEFSRRDYTVTHVVYFASNPSLQERDILVTSDSRQLQVMGILNFDELNRLWRVECEEQVGKSL